MLEKTMTDSRAIAQPKVAGAPISWGVSEVDGWGFQLAPDRVLGEMRELGLTATEFGPEGFLPDAPADKAALLSRFDLAAVGSFVPVVLHRSGVDVLPDIRRVLDDYAAADAGVLVLAAVTGDDGYDTARPDLTDDEWITLFANLDLIRETAAERGVLAVVHPHAGTIVESAADVERVLAGSTIAFCFDTGHLLIGGTDPVRFAAKYGHRVEHVHLKDVSIAGIQRVRSGELSYHEAVARDLLYRPLGQGDIDIRAILTSLVESAYDGWFVLEQDRVLANEPAPGEGPVIDARTSVEYLRAVLADVTGTEAHA
jgi:inosose dehydratase